MTKPNLLRVIIMNITDFFIITSISLLLTFAIYLISPKFTPVPLSFSFFEQWLELFFINPTLILWLLGLGFGVTLIYFLFCAMLYETTLGSLMVRLRVMDIKKQKPPALYQAILMAFGAYCGVVCLFISPFFAWWLDPQHRGWSLKLSKTFLMKKTSEFK